MNNANKSHHNFIQKCQEANLRLTPQRLAIYEEIQNDFSHPTASAIYKRIKEKHPSISLDTTNRTLLTFEELGIIHAVGGFGNGKKYDPDLGNHHHFQCIKCHKIIDFKDDKFDEIKVPKNITKYNKVLNKRIVLSGICEDCNK